MKKIVRSFFAFFGLKLSKLSSLKPDWRLDPFEYKKSYFSEKKDNYVIFDVGAYVGNISLLYREQFPNSTIYCFEPFNDSFNQMRSKLGKMQNVFLFNKGLSDFNGKSQFHSNKFAPTNSLLPTHNKGAETWETDRLDTKDILEVDIITLDSFIEENKISKIDILKLDVQGAELKVLLGGEKTLSKGIIDLIYTEILTMPSYEGQNNLDEIINFLRIHHYKLVNFYNLSLTNSGELRQLDAIFVRERN